MKESKDLEDQAKAKIKAI